MQLYQSKLYICWILYASPHLHHIAVSKQMIITRCVQAYFHDHGIDDHGPKFSGPGTKNSFFFGLIRFKTKCY